MYYNSFAMNKILAIHVYNVCKFFENKHKHNTFKYYIQNFINQ